ncbi:MAG: hypothetical protein ACMV16_08725, partial [Macromonas sp.]
MLSIVAINIGPTQGGPNSGIWGYSESSCFTTPTEETTMDNKNASAAGKCPVVHGGATSAGVASPNW